MRANLGPKCQFMGSLLYSGGAHGRFSRSIGQILIAFPNDLNGRWIFEITINRKAFIALPNCLDDLGQKITIIVKRRRPISWKWGETGHLSSSCPEKHSEALYPTGPNPYLIECFNVMGKPATRTVVVKPLVVYTSRPPFPENPLPTGCMVVFKEKMEQQAVGMAKTKLQ